MRFYQTEWYKVKEIEILIRLDSAYSTWRLQNFETDDN